MARVPAIDNKESLPPEQRGIYDAVARIHGQVRGPFLASLHRPVLAERTAQAGSYIRFESPLDPTIVELGAPAAARELECKHEWAAHVEHAKKAGLPEEAIRMIDQRGEPENFSFADAQIVSYVQELLRSRRVSEATLQAVFARLDAKGMVGLTATIGYYAMVACTLNAFGIASVSLPQDLKI